MAIVQQDRHESSDLTLTEIGTRVWRGRYWVGASFVLAVLLSSIYLHSQPFEYSIAMKVTASASSQNGGATRAPGLSGLASLAGISTGSQGGASPFEAYLETFSSVESAAILARDPTIMRTVYAGDWDAKSGAWSEPGHSVRGRILGALKELLGFPPRRWHQPGPRDLAAYLDGAVMIRKDTKSPVVVLAIDNPNPEFAKRLLLAASRATDSLIRQNSLTRGRENVEYIRGRLPTVTVAEHRLALIETLSDQEKSVMWASSSAPFAVSVLSGPSSSLAPTKPNSVAVILAGAMIGLMVGLLMAITGGRVIWRIFRPRHPG